VLDAIQTISLLAPESFLILLCTQTLVWCNF